MGFYHRKLLSSTNELNTTMDNGFSHSPAASPSSLAASLSHLYPHPDPASVWSRIVGKDHHSYAIQAIQIGMVIVACTAGVLLFFVTVFKILGKYCSRRSNFRRRSLPIIFDLNGDSPFSDDEEPAVIDHPIWFIHTVGLSQSVIDSITVCKYRKDEGLIDGTDCSVCLSEFEEDERLKLLPKCNHAFHVACIDAWLRSHKNCPLCRSPIVRDTASTEESVREARSNVSGVENEESQMELSLEESGGLGSHRAEEGGSSGPTVGDDEDRGYTEVVTEKTLKSSLFLTDPAMNGPEDDEEIQPVRRSISVDSCSASMIYGAMVHLNFDEERQGRQLDVRRNSRGKSIVGIGRQGIGGSTICKLASMGRALQKRPISMKRSFSHNRKFRSTSGHSRSQSSTLPL